MVYYIIIIIIIHSTNRMLQLQTKRILPIRFEPLSLRALGSECAKDAVVTCMTLRLCFAAIMTS